MKWQQYVKMSVPARRRIKAKALAGDEKALKNLISVSNSIAKAANQRVYRLEKAGYDYGKNYNNLINFTMSNYNTKRLKTAKSLKYDVYQLFDQTEIARKFLRGKGTTVSGAKEIERYRIDTWKEKGIIREGFTRKEEEDFLRFLGNESVTGAIDAYGTSDTIVEAIHDKYIDAKRAGGENATNAVFRILEKSLAEFNAGSITFDIAMERAGIKIEDYRTGRGTT